MVTPAQLHIPHTIKKESQVERGGQKCGGTSTKLWHMHCMINEILTPQSDSTVCQEAQTWNNGNDDVMQCHVWVKY